MGPISKVMQRVSDRLYQMAPPLQMNDAVPVEVAKATKLHLPKGEDTMRAALRDAAAGEDLTNVAIFSYLPQLEQHRLFEELASRGVRPHILNIDGVRQAQDGAFTYNGMQMPRLDGAVMYDGALGPASGPGMLDKLQASGTFIAQDGNALRLSRDKILSAEAFDRAGVSQPAYRVIEPAEGSDAAEALFKEGRRAGPRGVVIKDPVGTHGKGVELVRERSGIRGAIAEMRDNMRAQGHTPRVLAQELINAKGRDLRIVVGSDSPADEFRVLTSIQRTARKKGEFRANVALGGQPQRVQVSARQAQVAIDGVKALGMAFGGADVFQDVSIAARLVNGVRDSRFVSARPKLDGTIQKVVGDKYDPKLIEVNSGPDTSEWITGDDVFGPIANHVVAGTNAAKAAREAAAGATRPVAAAAGR